VSATSGFRKFPLKFQKNSVFSVEKLLAWLRIEPTTLDLGYQSVNLDHSVGQGNICLKLIFKSEKYVS